MVSDAEILINDSCILFDLIDLGLLDDFIKLGLKVYTTPNVIDEVIEDHQIKELEKCIQDGSINIDAEGRFEAIQLLYDEYTGLSYTDCSVLELAVRKGGIIISSDKGLRNISKRENINVRGLLWIVNMLLKSGVITNEQAIEKLKRYPEVNKRAPLTEVENFIHRIQIILEQENKD